MLQTSDRPRPQVLTRMAAAVVVCFMACFIAAYADLSNAECGSEGCSEGCKVHNRWCGDTIGFRTVSDDPIARTESCLQSPVSGVPESLDFFDILVYTNCARDCPHDTWTTGAPFDFSMTHDGFYETVCQTGS
jgi:hypothetical protein